MYVIEQRDEQLVNSKAGITYELGFDRAPQHLVSVRMRVDNVAAPELAFVMPSWSPGSYKIRDYAGWQGNVRCYSVNAAGRTELSYRWRDKASLVVSTQGVATVEVEYLIYAHERTVRTSHVNRFHAFLMLTSVCMYVEGRTQETHHVLLKHDQLKWPSTSTALSPVSAPTSRGILLGALNYDILADSPIEIGDHRVRTFTAAGALHEVAVATNYDVDIDWLADRVKRIVEVETELFGGAPYDRYVFIIQAYPGAGGGLEHARSSVNAVDPSALLDKTKAIGLLSLLCHEYFHLWNVKRIRPVELGPFDYTRETYTPMLWLAEGLTSYYDNLFAYRCGFATEKEYVDSISRDDIARLAQVQGRFAMSTRDSSYLAWLKLYLQSPDGSNRFPSYYLKGGIIIMLLDIYIIDHTDGKYSMDDALRMMWKRYQDDPSRGMTEDECIAIIEQATRVQVRERLMSWLDGKDELPYDEILKAVGYRVSAAPKKAAAGTFGEAVPSASVPEAPFIGWSLADVGGKVVVRAVDDGSPAQLAGIGIDDELVAIEGIRILNPAQADHVLGGRVGKAVQLTGHCDGRIYTTTIEARERMMPGLVEIDAPSERQRQMRSRWLQRRL
ncbi:MAG: M61 family metallopeptidase [Candidatus Kapabacteria bacterium]|nr:M61 family metallopeptidase [Candidatus Kapabacteria bacterium]